MLVLWAIAAGLALVAVAAMLVAWAVVRAGAVLDTLSDEEIARRTAPVAAELFVFPLTSNGEVEQEAGE